MCTLRVCTSSRHGVGSFVSSYPRLRSLRSLSLGLLRASLSEAVSHCGAWRMGIKPTPTLVSQHDFKKT